MSYFLPHLPSGWHVDEAIKSEEDRVVVIRFGHDGDSQCMTMDETLYSVAEKVQNFAVIYLTDITEVPDFNKVRGFFSHSSDRIDANWNLKCLNLIRCTNCTIHALSCSFIGKTGLVLSVFRIII
jgi:Mitosis protein DIM1